MLFGLLMVITHGLSMLYGMTGFFVGWSFCALYVWTLDV